MPPKSRFPTKEALQRYCMISAIQFQIALGLPRSAAVRLVSDNAQSLCARGRPVSTRTLQRWLRAYLEHGLDGLEPQVRESINSSKVLSQAFLTMLETEFSLEPEQLLSIPQVIAKARSKGIIGAKENVERTTVWRAVKRMGFDISRVKRVPEDTRRFAYSEPMQMVMADFKVFYAGPKRARRLVLFMIDDATRYVIASVVSTEGAGEAAEPFMRVVYEVLRRYGRFSMLYLDNGSAFVADMLSQVLSRLQISLVKGTPRYPAARGKVEKFNQDIDNALLKSLAGAEVDPTPAALTLRLEHYIRHRNQQPHSGLRGATPYARWTEGRPLRPIPEEELARAFVFPVERTVTNAHIVSVDGVKYEVPAGHARRKVTLERRLLEDNALYFPTDKGPIKLHEVDLVANAKAGRGRNRRKGNEPGPELVRSPTAAMVLYDRDLQPITDPDGGFSSPEGDANTNTNTDTDTDTDSSEENS